MVPEEPGAYVVARDGLAAVVRVGPAVAWDNVAGEVLWEVDAEESSSEAVHELRGAAVRGSLDLPAGWWWVAPSGDDTSPDDDDASYDDGEDEDLADAVARYGWAPETDPGLVALHARATHALQVQEQEDEARRAERRAWLDSVGGWPR